MTIRHKEPGIIIHHNRITRVAFAVIAGLLITCSIVLPAETSEYVKGKTSLSKGKWTEAERHFTACLAENPDHADSHALLGMALYHKARHRESVGSLEKALALKTRYAARSLYYLGMAYAALGEKEKAENAFSRVIALYPSSSEARKLGYIPADVKDAVRRGEAFAVKGTVITVDLGYDSNPTQVSGGDSDFFLDLYATTEMAVPRTYWTAGVSTFIEKFTDDSDNDFFSLTADLSRDFVLSDAGLLELILQYERSWYGSDDFESNPGLWLIYDRQLDRNWNSELRAGFVSHSDLSDSEDSTDGLESAGRVRAYRKIRGWKLIDRIRLEAELVSQGSDTDYLGYRDMSAGFEWRVLPADLMSVDMSIEYASRKYGDDHPVYEEQREDTSIEISLYLTYPLKDGLYLTAQLSHDTRSSNIDYYEEDETRLSAGLMYIP